MKNLDITKPDDDFCPDEATKREKAAVMAEQKKTARYFSIAETFQYISAVMLPLGLGVLVAKMGMLAGEGAALAEVAATLGTALASAPVAIFLTAATLCVGIAITSRYIAAHHLHNAAYNSTELNAQHTAKYLAKELQRTPVVEHNLERADGKTWAQAVAEKSATEIARC